MSVLKYVIFIKRRVHGFTKVCPIMRFRLVQTEIQNENNPSNRQRLQKRQNLEWKLNRTRMTMELRQRKKTKKLLRTVRSVVTSSRVEICLTCVCQPTDSRSTQTHRFQKNHQSRRIADKQAQVIRKSPQIVSNLNRLNGKVDHLTVFCIVNGEIQSLRVTLSQRVAHQMKLIQ